MTNCAFSRLEEKLGYRFGKRALVEEALTHRSSLRTSAAPCNERLEFLGDAVLSLVITEELFRRYPDSDEGSLSKHRARLVSAKHLAKLAEALAIDDCLILGKGEELGGGRRKPSLLADAFEAVVAAIYLDAGLDGVRRVVVPLFAEALAQHDEAVHSRDFKTELQELTQAELKRTPTYVLVAQSGPDHAKSFQVAVHLDGRTIGLGDGTTKKEASQLAALRALAFLAEEKNKEKA